jgi:hypothetical protein
MLGDRHQLDVGESEIVQIVAERMSELAIIHELAVFAPP